MTFTCAAASSMCVGLLGLLLAGCGSDPAPTTSSPSSTMAEAQPAPISTTMLSLTTPSVHAVPPERQDATFETALSRKNLTIADSSAQTVQFARAICARLEGNEPLMDLAGEVGSSAQLDPDNAGYVIGAATAVYCPEDLPKLRSR